MAQENLVSIITATFNSARYVTCTYESLRAQTHTAWEWLVTDDCSDDNTFDILSEMALLDARIKLARTSVNSGAAVARNESIARAYGEYLAFIDSDDYWLPRKLEAQLSFMSKHKINFSFTGYKIVNQTGDWTGGRVDHGRSGTFGFDDMLRKRATIGCSTVMLRRNAFSDLKMPPLRIGQDYAFWLNLLRSGGKAHLLGETYSCYRITPNSISRNKFRKARAQWHIYRQIEQMSFMRSSFFFGIYAGRALLSRASQCRLH
jgi:glycosyltransferase involved in cell wall biosynthesis